MKNSVLLILLIIINGCTTNTSRYAQKHDSTPTRAPHASELIDPVPRDEPHSRGGNQNYTVRGKHYTVLPTSENFKESGIASWYGNKFHGHLTSNGEIYNMYNMSAAHKNLPLPTYVKVTNHANNKSVIVRVNDRGPFHEKRIIDLSYSAAYKLGMLKSGTANVTIEAINYKQHGNPVTKYEALSSAEPLGYVQVFATSHKNIATKTAKQLKNKFHYPVVTTFDQSIYRVKLGGFNSQLQLEKALEKIKRHGYPKAFKTYTKKH